MMVGRSRMLGTWEDSIILRPVPLFVNYSIIVRIVREDGSWCCREIQLLWEQLLLHGLTTYRLHDHHHTFPTSLLYLTSLLFANCLCVSVCVFNVHGLTTYRLLDHHHTFPTSHPYPTSLLFAKRLCVTLCVWMYMASPHTGCMIIILPFVLAIKKQIPFPWSFCQEQIACVFLCLTVCVRMFPCVTFVAVFVPEVLNDKNEKGISKSCIKLKLGLLKD